MERNQAPVEGRRQRAPTITIDTSAVSSESSKSWNQFSTSSSILSSVVEGRPTTPHNVSSPTSRLGDESHGFLTVPGARSRLSSVEMDKMSDVFRSDGAEINVRTISGGLASDDTYKIAIEALQNGIMINGEDTLRANPTAEIDFEVENNRFAFSPGMLNKLVNPKSLSAFYAVGGLAGLEKGLRTNRKSGLTAKEMILEGTISYDEVKPTLLKTYPDQATNGPIFHKSITTSSNKNEDDIFIDRKRVFSDNRLPAKNGKSLLRLMWTAYTEKAVILLSIAAAVSLGFSLYQNFGTKHTPLKCPIECLEEVSFIIAFIIFTILGLLNDYQKDCQLVKLDKDEENRSINVVRSGKSQEISVCDVLVGDIVLINPGDMILVDGIFIEGHNVKCDESQATGESCLLHKRPADEVFTAIERGENLRKLDPFILSGARIIEGVGSFLVTSTGINSNYGKTIMSLQETPEVTPLQSKLNILAEYIAKLVGAAGLLLFSVLFILLLTRLENPPDTPIKKGQQLLGIFVVSVINIIVVAAPEVLPLAVTVALAFATTRMLNDNSLVLHNKACEAMGNATTICSDNNVAFTGNGTIDAPALKRADAGSLTGVAGNEFKKEISAIILMDDNFISIVKALIWGRARNDATRRFLQFQITVNVTAALLTFISAASDGSEEPVLIMVQLLWVNLIIDTIAALALPNDCPPLEGADATLPKNITGFGQHISVNRGDKSKSKFSKRVELFTLTNYPSIRSICALFVVGIVNAIMSHSGRSSVIKMLYGVRLDDLFGTKWSIIVGNLAVTVTVIVCLHLICGWAYKYAHPYDFCNRPTSLDQVETIQCVCQQHNVCECDRDVRSLFLIDLAEKSQIDLRKNGRLRSHSTSKHKLISAKQVASALHCFAQQPMSGLLVLLPFICTVTALDDQNPAIAMASSPLSLQQRAIFGASILVLCSLFVDLTPSLFGLVMGALSIAWIPIRNDSRTSPEVYWAVFASWGVSTVMYGSMQFSKKKMGQPYVLIALVLTLVLVGLSSQMYEKTEVVEGLITCFPPMLSLSVFAVSHIPTLLGWIEVLTIHLGSSIVAIGRLPTRLGEENEDLEAGILLRNASP